MSPCSNSTHTPAPTCGRTHTPDCLPVIGRQGIAHVLGIGPPTSGTWTNSRPICIGSTLLSTVPRYLPQYFPSSLMSNPYAERLIGTLRRNCLDHILIFDERHLRRILTLYSLYYNETRTHLGLGKDAPLRRSVQRSGTIVTTPILSGLHHRYAPI